MKKEKNIQSINIKNSQGVQIGDLSINSSKDKIEEKERKHTKKIELIHKLVSNGDAKLAIDELLKIFKNYPKKYETGIILLNRLNRVETENRLGIIDNANKNLEINKINAAILELVRE